MMFMFMSVIIWYALIRSLLYLLFVMLTAFCHHFLFFSLSIMSFSSLTSPVSLHHSLSLSAPFPFLSHTLRLLVVLLFFSFWVCARSVALRSCSTGDSLLSSAFIRSAKSAPVLIHPVHPLLPDSVLTPLADELSGRALYARIGTLASDCVPALWMCMYMYVCTLPLVSVPCLCVLCV